MESAIYGELFEAAPDGRIVPDEATGYKYSHDNLQVDISIRHGVRFQDGTPFNAQAVALSIQRDLAPAEGCTCLTNFSAVKTITAPSTYVVRLTLSRPDAALISSFIDEAPNWTVSPTALKQRGEPEFAQHPVGAGPFEVVSDVASSKLVLRRNPNYWEKGHPYLDGLTFISTASDENNFNALRSGEAQMMSTNSVVTVGQAKGAADLKVIGLPALTIGMVRLNAGIPPFNNKLAREAVTYATNTMALISKLYDNLYEPQQGFESSGMLFFKSKVPGSRGYDPARARQLVREVGGITVTLQTIMNSQASATEAEALAAQWNAVGINTKIQVNPLPTTLQNFKAHSWEAFDGTNTATVDPGNSLSQTFQTGGSLSGTADATLDRLLAQGLATNNQAKRAIIYAQVNQRIDTQADAIFLYGSGIYILTNSEVSGVPLVAAAGAAGTENFENVRLG
jgi:peptide/nickel transport system substrate-binding protein